MRELERALKNLRSELARMKGGQRPFLARYRKARLHAFELEFLAKFLRKSSPANQEIFERIQTAAKDIEDRLGEFNELDELIAFAQKNDLALSSDLEKKRQAEYETLTKWIANWREETPAKLAALIAKLEPLGPGNLRAVAIKKMAKVCREIQNNVDSGAYDPRKKSGYSIAEVEPKIHELRREIRKIPMYANYLRGSFALTDKFSSTKHFKHLRKSKVAKSPFAKLPKASAHAILIPRDYFLAITKFVSELGWAKDWAQNLQRLRETGIEGELSFDQIDVSLKDCFGHPVPFNRLTLKIIKEIRDSKLFTRLADSIESQR